MPAFEKVNSKVIKTPVGPGRGIIARRGSMLGYTGEVSFRPIAHPGGAGMAGIFGRMVSGENEPLMLTDGTGEVMFGHAGLHIELVSLQGDQLRIEASRVLCHDETLMPTVQVLGQGGMKAAAGALMSGQGLATSIFNGFGELAILSHGTPFKIPVQPGTVVSVDPQAFVAAQGSVTVELKSSAGMRDFIGKGSGEAFQLLCQGTGSVWIQPSEEKL